MAKRKIIISERDNIAALFEGEKAIEFIINRGEMLLGDVYLSEVENILPSIDAAFVSVSHNKMGFLHSSDVEGRGELKSRLKPKQRMITQVIKEPTGHKGPRVTTNLSLPGRFLVVMPESRGISISRKIENPAERARLKSICNLMKPSGVGIIIRTEAQGQSDTDIQEDLEVLIERWQTIASLADTVKPPALLYRDQDLLYRVVRELVTEDVEELVLDTAYGAQRAQQLLQNWNLDKSIKVTAHTGATSIMVAKNVEREIKQALQTKVPLPSGGYLYIQPTEALCVVDVNSGRFTSLQSQSQTIKITNLEACKEIARQLRLRNIGGMVVVDFIDMDNRADQLAVLQAFEADLAPDKAKPQVGQLTDLGLVEMTRHRQGQALSEIFGSQCGACHGTGHGTPVFNWASTSGEPSEFRPMGSRAIATPGSGGAGTGRSSSSGRSSSTNGASKPAAPLEVRAPRGAAAAKRGAVEHAAEVTDEAPVAKVPRTLEAKPPTARGGRPAAASARSKEKEVALPLPENDDDSSVTEGTSPVAARVALPQWLMASVPLNPKLDVYEVTSQQLAQAFGLHFALSVPTGVLPRAAHQWLSRLNAQCTSFMSLYQAFKYRQSQGNYLPMMEEDEEQGDASSDTLSDAPPPPAVTTASLSADRLSTLNAEVAAAVAPATEATTDPNGSELLAIVEEVVKPALLGRLMDKLQTWRHGDTPEGILEPEDDGRPAKKASASRKTATTPAELATEGTAKTRQEQTQQWIEAPATQSQDDLDALGLAPLPNVFEEPEETAVEPLDEVSEAAQPAAMVTPSEEPEVLEAANDEPDHDDVAAEDEEDEHEDEDDEAEEAPEGGVTSPLQKNLVKVKPKALVPLKKKKPKKPAKGKK
jgi:ribonuclease E